MDKKEKLTAGLNQTVKELQQLLQTVSWQLSKRQEGVRTADMTHWEDLNSMATNLNFTRVRFPPGC